MSFYFRYFLHDQYLIKNASLIYMLYYRPYFINFKMKFKSMMCIESNILRKSLIL